MKSLIKFLGLILFTSSTFNVNGQGCSDAGFCTINSFKPNSTDTVFDLKNQFKVGLAYGTADNSISIFGPYLEYNRIINDRFGLDVKITSLSQAGNNITTFGLSDLFVTTNYKVDENLKLIIGTKIPFTNSSRKENNLPLPMDYQSSLGTFDLILGFGFNIKNFQIVGALQQPLSQNKNEFISESYPINSKLRAFQSTNRFKRSGDILVRLSYPIKICEKFRITPSLLPIYHLSDDKYTDAFDMENQIAGSKGLTLNGNLYFDFDLNKKTALQLNLGAPFIVRTARPDGLTRSFIANLEYRIKF